MTDYSQHKLWERELIFKDQHKDLPQGNYAILWEDPADPEAPAKVTRPSPTWLAMAMHGGILPPVEVYWALCEDEADPNFKSHTRGHLLHNTQPLPAMTEEEAMEYLIMKDIPRHIWSVEYNRPMFRIVKTEDVPSDRQFRNAWKLAS